MKSLSWIFRIPDVEYQKKTEWVFGIYNTTTAEQGGGGIGLFAVRMRVRALNGIVVVKDSEFAPLGTTIHIELPFKK